MSGTWISDRPESEEHPIVPLGLNEMMVPRISIVASFATIAMLFVSTIWLALAASSFLSQFEDAFAAVNEDDIQVNGRWTWEATLLFEGCDARNGEWNWPSNLAAQDDVFWYPGELSCIWEHQGVGDYAHLAIHNVDDENALPLSINISHPEISIDGEGQNELVEVGAGDAIIIPLRLESMIEEADFSVTLSHISLPSAEVVLDVELFTDGSQKDRHTRSEHLDVEYYVSDADSGDYIDDGTLPAYAGEDPRCGNDGLPWVCYIEGFGWGLVGLDVDNIDPQFSSGTTHVVILPPDLAYGDRDGHQYQDTWMRFELSLGRLLPA